MDHYQLDTARLKTIRTSRKIGRSKLAKLTGLTERQVSKLEGSKGAAVVPEPALFRIAEVLDVPALTLTGDLNLEDCDLTPSSAMTCTKPCCS